MIEAINIFGKVDTKDSETEMLQDFRNEIKASGFEAILKEKGFNEEDYNVFELIDGQSEIVLMYDKI